MVGTETKAHARSVIQVSLRDYESRKAEIGKELWKAASETGFFYLCDTGISAEYVEKMFNMSKAFFALPNEQKADYKLEVTKNVGWESGTQKRKSHPLPELKESMQLQWNNMEGKWPSNDRIPGFEQQAKEFMGKVQEVSFRVLSCFALGMGFEEDFFTKNHDVTKQDAQQTCRLLHYFSVEGKEFPKDYPRAGSHTDWSTLTLLFTNDSGLEICPGREAVTEHAAGDTWTPCPAIPGNIIVNIGDALMRWSGDQLKSTHHKVRMPAPGEDQSARYSIAYFNQPNKPAIIADKAGKYPAITAEQFIKDQLKANYS